MVRSPIVARPELDFEEAGSIPIPSRDVVFFLDLKQPSDRWARDTRGARVSCKC